MDERTTPIKAGNSDDITRRFYDSFVIEMRLINAALPRTDIELFGQHLTTPIITAAVSRLNETCPDGFSKMAEAIKNVGTIMCMGIGEASELETIAATGTRAVKIIKPYKNEDIIFAQLDHARAIGAKAAGMDIDHCFQKDGTPSCTREGDSLEPKSSIQLRRYAEYAGIPFIVKGILSVQDAIAAEQSGAGAIVISHHHAIMDFAAPPPMLLPTIVKALNSRIPILVDCGIQTGIDAFKALALGATAVCVGRKLIAPLIKDGTQGVENTLHEMTAELAGMLARTSSPDPHHIDPTVLVRL